MDSVTPSKVVKKKEVHRSKQRKHTTYPPNTEGRRQKSLAYISRSLQNVHKPWKSVHGSVVLGQSETTCTVGVSLTIIKEAVATAYRFPFKNVKVDM